jgi:phosphatidylserine/phosphatidylglycerophosphate/cardiolipin synthase-like enzyme
MKRIPLTSWHFVLILAAVVLFLTGRNNPSNSQTETLAPTWEVYFSPHGGATSAIVKTLDQARKSILVQAYSFTSVPIASALVRARRRGVEVQVILDKSQRTDKNSSIGFLTYSGIVTIVDAAHNIAHNNVMIVDGEILITGSFNFTKAAEERNAENLLIIHSKQLAATFLENWRIHRRHSTPWSQPRVRK